MRSYRGTGVSSASVLFKTCRQSDVVVCEHAFPTWLATSVAFVSFVCIDGTWDTAISFYFASWLESCRAYLAVVSMKSGMFWEGLWRGGEKISFFSKTDCTLRIMINR